MQRVPVCPEISSGESPPEFFISRLYAEFGIEGDLPIASITQSPLDEFRVRERIQ